MNDASVMITASGVKRELDKLPADADVDDIVKRAFVASTSSDIAYMCATDDEQFRGGVGGLLLFYENDPDTTARIEHEITLLRGLSAATQGVPVDFGAMMSENSPEPLGLMGKFRDCKAKS